MKCYNLLTKHKMFHLDFPCLITLYNKSIGVFNKKYWYILKDVSNVRLSFYHLSDACPRPSSSSSAPSPSPATLVSAVANHSAEGELQRNPTRQRRHILPLPPPDLSRASPLLPWLLNRPPTIPTACLAFLPPNLSF